MGNASIIDVHSHFLPSWYIEEAVAAGHLTPDRMPAWPSWSVEDHLRMMDTHGIERSILSISSPGVHFGSDIHALALARRVNEFAADLVAARPERFGFFAALPLPAIDGSLREIAYALDTLGAEGVAIESNAGGKYLGDGLFEPVWAELGRRHSPVFIHPTSPAGTDPAAQGPPLPMIDYMFDTTRTIIDLALSGALGRHPGMQVIVPHSGAFLPTAVDRVELFQSFMRSGLPADHPAHQLGDLHEILRGLWFDMAGTPFPTAVKALKSSVGTDHLLYGSDFCFTPPILVARQIETLDAAWAQISDTPWRELTTTNALTLFAASASIKQG
ncbi:amidohydrolase family protein [Arthrobacter sp. GMC3]|uniref:amidohydrolase family protein n=1 Tax=Arthrobacter sp. GMC3 TaxID=2058894 RepID=UPI000CE34604|nr:amidohydrolase family protein [Arthrobacter sp. GMC3]